MTHKTRVCLYTWMKREREREMREEEEEEEGSFIDGAAHVDVLPHQP